MLDHDTFDVLGRWEIDRGEQYLHYDFWWHLGYDTMVTSEWGTPNMVESGVQPELLLDGQYGHRLHFWDLRQRRHVQTLDLGKEHQIVLELRPAHDPTKAYGFVNAVVSLNDLSASIFLWHRKATPTARRTAGRPQGHHHPGRAGRGGPAAAGPQAVQGRAAAGHRHRAERRRPVPLRLLLGHRRAEAVRRLRPVQPEETGSVRIGGIVGRAPHPASAQPLNGGPQMVEVSRDGRRVYVTNSLYCPGTRSSTPTASRAGWSSSMPTRRAACSLDPNFFLDFGDQRPHQVRLQGGDASSDSYCYP